jgi:EAL domain-containing protein (putative c-di-GMP-specific phosphodiesterase class I)
LTAERVLAALSAPFPLVGHTLRVSASIGISVSPRDAADVQSLIKYADAALYLAKEQGRNTFRFFSPDLDAKVRTRMHLENDLRCAVERQQFVLHYQPKIDLARRKIIGVEALIRWQHPENGLIPPSAFISVAEEMGLILPIGEWALRTACAQARAWRDDGVCDLRMEVNISSRQLHGIDIVATVKRILSETGCDPGLLGLEITESAVMTDPTEAIGIIRALHDMGIEIAIDDFGTGYSSLAYLKRFALNILKIDSTFVQGLPVDRDDVAIVQAIIALGHQFRLKVVAEGVETHAQKSFLTHHQCDAIQGFLISRALPSDEVRPLLQQTLAPCGLA